MTLTFHPLTPDRWPDLEALFGARGACGGCWCMVWRRTRAEFDANKGENNRLAFQEIVRAGDPPGLLAYDGDRPVGWCAVAPREDYPALARSRILKPLDDTRVWSVSCLFVARSHRRQGVSVALLRAAIDHVRERGGTVVEGYPVEPYTDEAPPAFVWTGLASAFLQAGFTECTRRSDTRPIMRYEVKKGKA